MRHRPAVISAWLLASALLIGSASQAWSFQLRIAPAVDQTACGWSYGDCGDDEVFARWYTFLVNYRVNNDAATDLDDPELTQGDIIGAVDASFQSWEDVPSAILRFANAGGTDNRVSGLDFVNTTLFYNAALDDDDCVGSLGEALGTFAITISTIKSTGEIVDVDVAMDSAEDWDWDDTDCVGLDMQSTLTHEYGHMVGFGHSDVCPADGVDRPTMCQYGRICDRDSKSRRTLEADDRAALQCLYPELPTLVVVDQTGSMSAGTRMADAKATANAFVDDYATNRMAIAGLADAGGGCAARSGYDLLQDWTDNAALLHAAINGTSACGLTPLWEATCCAIGEADTEAPSNLLIITDTGENNSDGGCGGCTTFSDVLATAAGTGVAVYVVDMTNYVGMLAATSAPASSEDAAPGILTDSDSLQLLAKNTGGLYARADSPTQLMAARQQIERHMAQNGQRRQQPPRCSPGPYAIDAIQRYTLACAANSPYNGQQVTAYGRVTVPRGPFDAATLYIEDCSGGIQVTMTAGPPTVVGDSVRVVGVVGSTSSGEIRISSVSNFMLLGPRPQPHLPVEDTPVGHQCEMLGRLIRVQGFVGGPVVNSVVPLVTAMGTAKPDTLPVYIDPDTGISPGMFVPGRFIVVTGILTRRGGRNELKPRFPSDVAASTVAVEPGAGGVPAVSGIRGIHPNPSRGEVEIAFYLARSGRASVTVHDVAGRVVRSLLDEPRGSGHHRVVWDGRDARGAATSAGVYFAQFRGPEDEKQVRSLVIIR